MPPEGNTRPPLEEQPGPEEVKGRRNKKASALPVQAKPRERLYSGRVPETRYVVVGGVLHSEAKGWCMIA